MIQVLLCGTGTYEGEALVAWIPQGVIGQTVKWNGSPWRISAQYGTRFSMGLFAKPCEKPRENPLERLN